MLRQIEWGVQNRSITKNRVLPVAKYFPFSKILFQFRNLVYRVDLMYQPSKCPYSYFSKSIQVLLYGVFFPVSILKIDLNAAEIRTASRLCMHQKLILIGVHIVLKVRVKQLTYESNT